MPKINVFTALESLLVKAIPQSVAKLRIKETICCLRVYYYDTHAPCTYLHLKTVTEAFRKSVLDEREGSALFYLWSSTEEKGDGASVDIGGPEEGGDIAKLFEHVNALLDKDEDKFMLRFRELLQQVCLKLNSKNWSKVCPVTVDFVVAPADGSQHFADDADDIAKSIPAKRLELLRSTGLLGPDRNWERRPGFKYAGDESTDRDRLQKEIEASAATMSTADRMAYWIDQLDKMAAGAACDVSRLGYNAHYPLGELEPLGKKAGPALTLGNLGRLAPA
jgi:hypothetical protein